MLVSLKHLRHGLKGTVSVPFLHTKKFSEGHVTTKTKKFDHQYDSNGEIVSVECMYQSVQEMTCIMVASKLTELKLKPADVKSIDFILGGDHGKEAFRLCFRVVITEQNDTMHHCDYGCAGTVFGKDTPEVLEKSIMPWLTEDLKAMNDSKFIIEEPDGDGLIVCQFNKVGLEADSTEGIARQVINHVEIYNTGDLKWMAMLLGMADMSNEWCIFCFMRKMQWSVRGHEKGEKRTMAKLLALASDTTKKGAERLGVKFRPYWDFIPIEKYTVPLLHILIGVFNDVDDFFMDLVDGRIIPVSASELKIRDDIKTMDDKIEPFRKAVEQWKETREGRDRSRLLTKYNRMNNLLKRGLPVGASTHMSVEETCQFQELDKKFKSMCKLRDDLKADKKKMKEKLEAYRRQRKTDSKSVYNGIETLAKDNGLDRGAAFGGKYNGKVARKVMENPMPIYDGVKDILKARKAPHITNEYIDKLCNDVVKVMESWNSFFSVLQKKTPTEEDRSKVEGIAKKAAWIGTSAYLAISLRRFMLLRIMMWISTSVFVQVWCAC